MKQPLVFDYHDYREFLGDSYNYAKNKNGKFSYRFFAQKAGFSSASFLKLVIDGKRNLTNESINRVSKAFRLKKQEHEFFEKLVFMNQASTHEIRNHYYKQMLSMKGFIKVNQIAKACYDYYSKWYYPVIREMVAFGNKKYNAEMIAQLLEPPISEKQALEALDHLLMLGLIKKDEEGRWEQCDKHISTGQEVRSMIVAQYHKEMLQLASDSIDRFSSSSRDISAMTFSMKAGKLEELKQLIAAFRDQVRSVLVEDESGDQVLQLNIQLFPLTKKSIQN